VADSHCCCAACGALACAAHKFRCYHRRCPAGGRAPMEEQSYQQWWQAAGAHRSGGGHTCHASTRQVPASQVHTPPSMQLLMLHTFLLKFCLLSLRDRRTSNLLLSRSALRMTLVCCGSGAAAGHDECTGHGFSTAGCHANMASSPLSSHTQPSSHRDHSLQ